MSEATSARTTREHEAAGPHREGRGEIGAEHVERAVRQIDEVHDAENERQPRRQQKQQHAQLHAVKALLDEIQHGAGGYEPRAVARRRLACRRPGDGVGMVHGLPSYFIGHLSWKRS